MPNYDLTYWDQFEKGNAARTILAQEELVEYSTFAGSDIKAIILPDGDQIAREKAAELISAISTIPLDNRYPDALDLAADAGQFFNTLEQVPDLKEKMINLVNLQSITISTYRSKPQVRALGHVNAVGLARGSRTIAGTLVFTEFDRDPFINILTTPTLDMNVGDHGPVLADQMRPFDIILLYAHELGNLAIRQIYGAELVTNGVVYSIQDYFSEQTCSYIAQDITPLIPVNAGGRVQIRRMTDFIIQSRKSVADSNIARLRAARSIFK